MNNKEIDEYLESWVQEMKCAQTKGHQILGTNIAIGVLLAEIAKRLKEPTCGDTKE